MSAIFLKLNRRAFLGPLSPSSWLGRQRRCLATSAAGAFDKETQERYRITTIRLYRILQRTCRSFAVESKVEPILLQPILEATDWGRHSIFTPPSPTMMEELYRLFYVWNDEAEDTAAFAPSSIDDWYYDVVGKTGEGEEGLPPVKSMTCWTSTEQIQQAVRAAFRMNYDLDPPSLHTLAIFAIQLLQEQQLLWSHSSVATTEGVRVTATSRYVLSLLRRRIMTMLFCDC
jgi:hypothetical protein